MKGCVWANNSCVYDSFLCGLWVAFLFGNEDFRQAFMTHLRNMGCTFMRILNHDSSFLDAKEDLLHHNFFNSGSKLKEGSYETYSRAVAHLLSNVKISIIDEDDMNAVCYEFEKVCENPGCPQCSQSLKTQCATDTIYLNNDLDYTSNMQSLVNEYFTNLKRSYHCSSCKSRMKEINRPTKVPILLLIHLSGKEFTFEVDKEIKVLDTTYELVYIVYYGDMHFITRMNTPLGQYEYDGMRNNAVFRNMSDNNFFGNIITDFYKTKRQAEGIAYRKKS
jgi:hypothetical protein